MLNEDLFIRHPDNPLLTSKDIPSNAVFNAGVAKFNDQVLLLARVEDREGTSFLVAASSSDGVHNWKVDYDSKILPDKHHWGIEDPRVIWLPDIHQWAILYTEYSHHGSCIGLALTQNFKNYKRLGTIMHPENKDAALFPERMEGCYWLIHRPNSQKKNIWISKTPNIDLFTNAENALGYWGHPVILMSADGSPRWDGNHLGIGPPPL